METISGFMNRLEQLFMFGVKLKAVTSIAGTQLKHPSMGIEIWCVWAIQKDVRAELFNACMMVITEPTMTFSSSLYGGFGKMINCKKMVLLYLSNEYFIYFST